MQIHRVLNHPIHDASQVKPEDLEDVLVYYGFSDRDPLPGSRGYYSSKWNKWYVDDAECDPWSGDKYRDIDGTLEKVYAWSKLPEISITA